MGGMLQAILKRSDKYKTLCLEREVVDSAKQWATAMRAEFNTGDRNSELNELFEYEQPLYAAVNKLMELEARQ